MISELVEEQNAMNEAIRNQRLCGKVEPTTWHLKQAIMQQVLMDMQSGESLRTSSVILTLSIHNNNG